MRLSKQVAIVTGAAGAIGAATAVRLAAEGAKMVLGDLDLDRTRAAADTIVAAGGEARAVRVNVADRTDVESLVRTATDVFGRLDVLVTCAGIVRDNLIHRLTDADWHEVLDVHLTGTFLCCQEAQRVMVPQRYGRIITVSSTVALGNRGQANYAAAKAGVQGFTRTLAIELGPFGITANCLAPGFIETDMTRAAAVRKGIEFESLKEQAAQQIPVGRVGTPEDVAHAAAFLADPASGFVNGLVIYLRGGPGQG